MPPPGPVLPTTHAPPLAHVTVGAVVVVVVVDDVVVGVVVVVGGAVVVVVVVDDVVVVVVDDVVVGAGVVVVVVVVDDVVVVVVGAVVVVVVVGGAAVVVGAVVAGANVTNGARATGEVTTVTGRIVDVVVAETVVVIAGIKLLGGTVDVEIGNKGCKVGKINLGAVVEGAGDETRGAVVATRAFMGGAVIRVVGGTVTPVVNGVVDTTRAGTDEVVEVVDRRDATGTVADGAATRVVGCGALTPVASGQVDVVDRCGATEDEVEVVDRRGATVEEVEDADLGTMVGVAATNRLRNSSTSTRSVATCVLELATAGLTMNPEIIATAERTTLNFIWCWP